MRSLSRISVAVAALAISITTSSQNSFAQETKKEPTGSIAGRITVGDKPVPRAIVLLRPSDNPYGPLMTPPGASRATTDEDGRYRITRVPAGTYSVVPSTPAFVVPSDSSFGQPGKSVTLSEGEAVDDMDFSLTRGAVITGRVTDAEGRPVIDQRVELMLVDEQGKRLPSFRPNSFGTDDRGVYRVYGLSPGLYKVSLGDSPDGGMVRVGFGGSVYSRTFHPGVSDESKAAVIEVKAGGEATNVDIKMGGASKTYTATGRIIDADTGKPLADLLYGHGAIVGQQSSIGSFGWSNNRSNKNGEFLLEGLSPGRFAAFVVNTEQVDFYSDPAVFEVADADVTGLEVKVRRGSSISGIVVIDGANDPELLAKTPNLTLRVVPTGQNLSAPNLSPIRINPDGNFRITGLRPGQVRIFLSGSPLPKGFTLLRVERDGVVMQNGIEIGPGENVAGVRVTVGYGTGVIRGDVKIEGGQLAADTRLRIIARRLDAETSTPATAAVDARGRFSIEGMMPGDYEVTATFVFVRPIGPPINRNPRSMGKQRVTVTNGSETTITLVIDLAPKDKDSEK